MTNKTYYDVLGIGPNADGTAVQRTYWQLARKYQALAPSDPRARQQLDELNEAYGVLGTPASRDTYDENLGFSPEMEAPTTRSERSGGLKSSVGNLLRWRPRHRADQPPFAPSAPLRPTRRSSPMTVDEMRLSTASIVGRWRQNATPDVLRTQTAPDTTLVDIFQSERAIDEPAEPLSAVLDVLRGSREPASSR